jgi:glycosyltransferase involved in cell wall biosynthesis
VSPVVRRARAALRVLRAEGALAACRRTQDHVEEWRRRRGFVVSTAPIESCFRAPVLNVLTAPPAPWSGGVATQFRARLAAEGTLRSCAVFFPDGAGYRLELRSGERRRAARIPAPRSDAPVLEDGAFEEAVLQAADLVGAGALHFEGADGLPLEGLLGLTRSSRPIILSLHDFSLFCRRPHLVEWPAGRFCDYCRDDDRCSSCLRETWPAADSFQPHHRATAAALLGASAAVVYPSPFLQQMHARLFPSAMPVRQRVIPPSSQRQGAPGCAPPFPPRAIALVGAVHAHKGARVFETVARGLAGRRPAVRMDVVGGGAPEELGRLRRLPGVCVTGYYRAGSLGALLRRRGVGLALLLSIWPEAYCLALDECLEAGVPVIAFDHGAAAERIRASGAGFLVAPSDGSAGIFDAALRVLDGRLRLAVPDVAGLALPTSASAARSHLELYADMGLVERPLGSA